MEARYHELSNQLARLNRGSGSGIGEPPNPGFEPEPSAPVQPAHNTPGRPGRVAGLGAVTRRLEARGRAGLLDRDRRLQSPLGSRQPEAHRPRRCRLSVTSGDFVPNSASSMMIQAYFRAEPPRHQVRLWIEGEVGGQPYLRRSEFTVPRPGSSGPCAPSTCRPGAWTRRGCGLR